MAEYVPRNVHEELWRVFTKYAINENPRHPEALNSNSFSRLCKESHLIGKGFVAADANLIFTSVVSAKGPSKGSNTRSVDFENFLTCMSKVAEKKFPKDTREDAFQNLLVRHVLKFATRLRTDHLEDIGDDMKIQTAMVHFKDPLSQIFSFYASNEKCPEANKHTMKFENYWKWCNDTKLSSASLTNTELAEIFMLCSASRGGVRSITCDEFEDLIIKLAVTKYAKSLTNVGYVNMVKGFLQEISENMKKEQLAIVAEARKDISTNSNPLIHGWTTFHSKFFAVWNDDGQPDYLAIQPPTLEAASAMLNGLLNRRPSRKELQDRNILKDEGVAPSLHQAQQALENKQKADNLKGALAHRPDADELLQKNILKSTKISPALQEQQQRLFLQQNQDNLAALLSRRPSLAEMLEKNLIDADSVDNGAVAQSKVGFKK